MKVSVAKKYFFDYHRVNSKKNTLKNYELLLTRFCCGSVDKGLLMGAIADGRVKFSFIADYICQS